MLLEQDIIVDLVYVMYYEVSDCSVLVLYTTRYAAATMTM